VFFGAAVVGSPPGEFATGFGSVIAFGSRVYSFSRGKLPKSSKDNGSALLGLLRPFRASLRCLRFRGNRRRDVYVLSQRGVARGFFLFALALPDRELTIVSAAEPGWLLRSFSRRGGEKQERLCRYPVLRYLLCVPLL